MPVQSPRNILLLTGFFCLLWTGTALGREWIPVPSWMEKTQVADRMVINGLEARVIYFTTDRSSQDVLEFYRQRWDDGTPRRPGYREVRLAPYHILSRLEGTRLLTVQVRDLDPGGSTGYLAETELKARKQSDLRIDIPKMNGSRIVNDLTSSDPGRIGRTLLIVNNYSARSNADFYRNYYRTRGWDTLVDNSGDKGQTLVFRRGDTEAHLVISSNFGTTDVVMNIVSKE